VAPLTLNPAGAPAITRPSPYAAIHGAMRRSLDDTLARLALLGTPHGGDVRAIGDVLAQARELLRLLRRHAQIEHLFVHPAGEAQASVALHTADSEHELDLHALGELLAECEALAGRPEAAAMQRLRRHLAHLAHLAHSAAGNLAPMPADAARAASSRGGDEA